MELPRKELGDQRAMELSPSPPLTARVLTRSPHNHTFHQPITDNLYNLAPSASQRRKPLPHALESQRTRHTDCPMPRTSSHGGCSDNEEKGAEEKIEKSVDQQPYSNTNSTSTLPNGPLSARPLNVAPVLRHKGRSASLYNIPAPEFEWDEGTWKQLGDDEEVEDPESSLVPSSQQKQQRRTNSASNTSATRHSSVIGPDPRDCIDLPYYETPGERKGYLAEGGDGKEDPQKMRAEPLPHDFYQREQLPLLPPSPPATETDLTALVNAHPVAFCRSDSHGQILLVDDRDFVIHDGSRDRSRRGRRGSSSTEGSMRHATRSASIRAPTEPGRGGEEEEEQETAGKAEMKDSAAASASPPTAAYADLVFTQDYFYYPVAFNPEEGPEVAVNEAKDRTPGCGDVNWETAGKRRTSVSSSSMPHWAHPLAEETPFTPFDFAQQHPAAATATTTGSSPVVPAAGETTSGENHVPPSSAVAANSRRVSVLDDLATGALQRLTVQEVVAAVLTAPSPLPSAAKVRETALQDVEANSDVPLDEPAPRKPGEGAHHGTQSSSQPHPQVEQADKGCLLQRVEAVRARLLHVDNLVARFDAVIDARQAELQTLTQKNQEFKQQSESHRARAAMARKEVRRLRDRQHTREELQLLHDMLVDRENLLAVAQARLLSLKRLRQQLDLLHAASTEKSQLTCERRESGSAVSIAAPAESANMAKQTFEKVASDADAVKPFAQLLTLSPPQSNAGTTAVSPLPSLPPPTARPLPVASTNPTFNKQEETVEEAAGPTAPTTSEHEEEVENPPQHSVSVASSSASSLASLTTCDIMDDFLGELLTEVDGLAKVCIQLPSPPPAMLYCNRVGPSKGINKSGSNDNWGKNRPDPCRCARPTYSTLNRHLNDGNNGFFSFFGGATEAHLNSKPLSTFLANLHRLARSSWELEEEVQLRARELATDLEEEELRVRLMEAYGLADKPDGANVAGDARAEDDDVEKASELQPGSLLSPITHPEPSHTKEVKGAVSLSEEATPSAATTSSDNTTRQLFLSSPEHGRRSRGGSTSGGSPLNPRSMQPPSSPLLLRRPTSVSLLLPTLIYAYPRIAAVSQHLDGEQQQIQKDYAALIAAARQQRRELTSRLRDAFRLHVAPALQQKIETLQKRQTSLARQLGELGVKEVTLEWEEEEPEMPDETALRQLMDAATAAGRRRWLVPRRRGVNHNANRSRSRISAYSVGRGEEDSSYSEGEAPQDETASLTQAIAPPVCHVYRRTLHVVCEAPVEAANTVAVHRAFSQLARQSQRHGRHTLSSAEELGSGGAGGAGKPRSARSSRHKPSAGSGRCRNTAAGAASCTSATGPSLLRQGQLRHATMSAAAASEDKTCAALQLYTHSPSQLLLQLARRKHQVSNNTMGHVKEGNDGERTVAANTDDVPSRHERVALTGTSSQRCSGGTPRVSAAPTVDSSATTRNSTATNTTTSARGGAPMPPSPRNRRTSPQPVSPRLHSSGRQYCSHGAASPAITTTMPPPVVRNSVSVALSSSAPVVRDTRVRLWTDLNTPYSTAPLTLATPLAGAAVAAASPWSPFEPNYDALADGAVHVSITFTGVEAHRRQVAQQQREAYQREFWQLREELARTDEDIFQLRTKYADLCAAQQRTEMEQAQKLAEAEAKVKKCRSFYKALKRENKEWQDICDELQRVVCKGK